MAVPDGRDGGDELLVPAGVEGAYGFLDQRVGLAERRVDGGGEADRPDAVVRREGSVPGFRQGGDLAALGQPSGPRSEEHTSELQSLMRLSYAVSRLQKKKL